MSPPVAVGTAPQSPSQEAPPQPQVFVHEDLIAMLPDNTGPVDLGCSFSVVKVWTGLREGDDARYVTGWVFLLQIGSTTIEVPEHIWHVMMYKLHAAGLIPQ